MATLAGRLGALVLAMTAGATPVPFTPLPAREAPSLVRDWIRAHRQSPATGVVHDAAHTYLMATAGEQQSGGYALRFTEVVLAGDEIVATVVLTRPRPDAPVTMGLSYPAASARIGRTERPVVFRTTEAPAP